MTQAKPYRNDIMLLEGVAFKSSQHDCYDGHCLSTQKATIIALILMGKSQHDMRLLLRLAGFPGIRGIPMLRVQDLVVKKDMENSILEITKWSSKRLGHLLHLQDVNKGMSFIRFLPSRHLPKRNLPADTCRSLVPIEDQSHCRAHIFGLINGKEVLEKLLSLTPESLIASMPAHGFFVIFVDWVLL
jgi:hypothetical protein